MAADPCGGIFLFIIVVIIVVNIIASITKSAKQLSEVEKKPIIFGKMHGIDSTSNLSIKRLSEVEDLIASSGAYTSKRTKKSRSKKVPINWYLIKVNLTKEQIEECFDMKALAQGVKKKDLPKYVHLDKLRQYFTEAQLRNMLDLDFFEKAQAQLKTELKPPSKLIPKLTGLSKKVTTTEKVRTERVSEIVPKEIVTEKVKEETVAEIVKEERALEKVLEGLGTTFEEDPLFHRTLQKINIEDRKVIVRKMQELQAKGRVSVDLENVVQGIIWSEILTPKTF